MTTPAAVKADPIEHPAHYTGHPSGVECIEVIEWFPANLANAWKYLHRQELKGAAREDLQKCRWYIHREIRRRRILARRKALPDAFVPVALPKIVARYLRHESGLRRELFSSLWDAFQRPLNLDSLRTASMTVGNLLFSNHLDERGTAPEPSRKARPCP